MMKDPIIRRAKKVTPPKIKSFVKKRINRKPEFIYNIDSPSTAIISDKKVIVEGWVIPLKANEIRLIRVMNNNQVYKAKLGKRRPDVHSSFKKYGKKALYSGFSVSFEVQEGDISIDVDYGKGFKKVEVRKVRVGNELLVNDYKNPQLSNNYAEHLNLLANKKTYYYESESESEYIRDDNDPRLMAFYLPQFHPVEINNNIWGKGFTEWTNVTSGVPRFIGHQQPILPSDLGFYDLRNENTIKEQIDLAKKYGIYGFCFYYYWFSGNRILERPLQSFLNHQEWDFSFTICWANENWTKRWDGRDDEVIIAQEYRKTDPLDFIKDVAPILNDPRYVQEEGKPILLVYRASELKEPNKYVQVWRDYFRKKYKKELQLVSVLSFDDKDPSKYGFDAALDFAPLTTFFKHDIFPSSRLPFLNVNNRLLDQNFQGTVMDYRSIALNPKLHETFNFPTYKSTMPSWDNDSRKKGKGFVFYGSNPDIYATWLNRTIRLEQNKIKPLIFINAWNEWAEGTMLEPSQHLGHAVLKRTVEVLSMYSNNKKNVDKFPAYGIKRTRNTNLAVVIHLYYTETWPKIFEKLKVLDATDIPYDIFISINIKDIDFKEEILKYKPEAFIKIVPNRGRDVLPFMIVAQRLKTAGYKYVLKIHSKKSLHRSDGKDWFDGVINNLLPNKDVVKSVVDSLDSGTPMIGPAGHLVSLDRHMGSNGGHLSSIFNKLDINPDFNKPEKYCYFAGTMFWARIDALETLIDLHFTPEDFESEEGQIDGTMAHAVERAFGVMALNEKQDVMQSSELGVLSVRRPNAKEKYKFAP